MIDRGHAFPISGRTKMLGLARSAVYYKPRPVSVEDMGIMWRLDELHLDCPFAGAGMLRSLLRREGVSISRCHVATLMRARRNGTGSAVAANVR